MPIIGHLQKSILFVKSGFMGKDTRLYQYDGGDDMLVEYPLNTDSRVIEVGGFRGDWVNRIYDDFGCKIYVFEPIGKYCEELFKRFRGIERIKIYNKGLSDRAGIVEMGISGDSSGEFVKGVTERVYMYEVSEWIRNKGFQVDLININCEGGEYGIFDNLISTGLIGRFKNIQVQFHNLNSQDGLHRNLIRKELTKTHNERWCYPWVWESWSLK